MTDQGDDEIVTLALKDFERDQSHWNEIYERAEEDLHFLSDEPYAQWDSKEYASRAETGRPTYTVDQLSQFVHQVANDIRQNTPSITIIPDGDEASVETAEVRQGAIRNIEYASNADDAYDTAALFAVKSSLGFIRVDHDYINDDSFDQTLLIKRVINPLACYLDCESIESDGRDAKRGTILDKMTVAEFKKQWPDFEPVSFGGNKDKAATPKDTDYITIAEHFRIVEEEKTVTLDENGEMVEYQDGMDFKVKRKIKKCKVMRYRLSGRDKLEETKFPGIYIPLIPVYGEEAWINGERHLFSLIRKSKQAQQMYNLWKSLETELLMKQPNAPVMAAAGSIENYAADWKDPSKSMALRFDVVDSAGNALPQPQRLEPPTIPTGIVNAARETVDDIKATMGLYNASIGQRSNEQSGVAINARKVEGDVATFHFSDNLVRSITQVGRVLNAALGEVIDTPRIIRTMGVEDTPQEVGVNGAMVQDQEEHHDLSKGKYSVKVITGPSYTTQRQETASALSQLFQAQPALMTTFGDIFFKNSDFAGAQALAARAKKLLPPALQDDNKDVDPAVVQLQQELEQSQQIIQQGAQELQALQQQLASKQGDLAVKSQDTQYKAQSDSQKLQLELAKLEQESRKAEAELAIKQQELALKERELDLKEAELAADIALKTSQQNLDQINEIQRADLVTQTQFADSGEYS